MKKEVKQKCCENCYHDIENGVVFTLFSCESCPCHQPQPKEVQEWEEELSEFVKHFVSQYYQEASLLELKSFIRNLLTEERNRIREEIEGMKRMVGTDIQDISPAGRAYNQALSDLLEKLK